MSDEFHVEPDDESGFEKIYSCLPMKNYQVGDFHFIDGQMTLRSEVRNEEFQAILNHPGFPASDRIRIKTIDVEAAERLIAAQPAAATRGMDQGLNPEVEKVKAATPKIGTDDIGKKTGGNT